MNSKLKHSDINAELLQKYFSGKLSESEKNSLEKLALDDPFLKDAMEGFESHPGSFDAYYSKHVIPQTRFSSIYLIIGVVLTSLLVTILVVLHKPEPLTLVQNTDSTDTASVFTTEVEVIPEFIDTLTPSTDADQIKVAEVIQARTEIQKTIDYPTTSNVTPILILEEDELDEDFKLIPEEHDLTEEEMVPAAYLFDLFVVDYRRIQREREHITYIKYEFTGTSAEYESETHEQNAELLEKEIDISYWEYLSKAMESFSNGNYKSALTRFETILEQYKDDFNSLFYGGLCYYNLGNFNKALDYFNHILATDLNAFKEETAWYKSKCHLKLGQKKEAAQILDTIISGGGFYAAQAIEVRKKL